MDSMFKFFFLAFNLFCSCLFAQSNWNIRFGATPYYDIINDIVLEGDSFYFVSGTTGISQTTETAGFLARVNRSGAVDFNYYYDTPVFETINSLVRNADGTFMLGGKSGNSLASSFDNNPLLIQVDRNGSYQWAKVYPQSNFNSIFKLIPLNNSGLLALMENSSPANTGLARFDSLGNVLWSKKYFLNFPNRFILEDIILNVDSSITFSGTGTFNSNYGVIGKADLNGNILWTKWYNLAGNQGKIISTTGNGYLTAYNYYNGGSGLSVIKTDSLGTIQWAKSVHNNLGNLQVTDLLLLSDGNFLLTAFSPSGATNGGDMIIMKINNAGDIIWSNAIGDIFQQMIMKTLEDTDNSLILGGVTGFNGFDDAFLIRSDSSGTAACGNIAPSLIDSIILLNDTSINITTQVTTFVDSVITLNSALFGVYNMYCFSSDVHEAVKDVNKITIFPNPFKGELSIDGTNEMGTIEIFDVLGKKIKSQECKSERTSIQLTDLHQGSYVLRYFDTFSNQSVRIIKN